jgi:hypothetical protein
VQRSLGSKLESVGLRLSDHVIPRSSRSCSMA